MKQVDRCWGELSKIDLQLRENNLVKNECGLHTNRQFSFSNGKEGEAKSTNPNQ
jgi:hypothetical protein